MRIQNNPPPFVIGITATRCSGKDLLYSRLRELSPLFHHFAFAYRLKEDLSDLVRHRFGWNIYDLNPHQKEIIRPILIAYGMAQRMVDPLHWVKIVCSGIDRLTAQHPAVIPVITDVRFLNEVQFLRSQYGNRFKLIRLHRIDAPEPTEEEKKHYPEVEKMADLEVTWGGDTPDGQREHAKRIIEHFEIDLKA